MRVPCADGSRGALAIAADRRRHPHPKRAKKIIRWYISPSCASVARVQRLDGEDRTWGRPNVGARARKRKPKQENTPHGRHQGTTVREMRWASNQIPRRGTVPGRAHEPRRGGEAYPTQWLAPIAAPAASLAATGVTRSGIGRRRPPPGGQHAWRVVSRAGVAAGSFRKSGRSTN